MGIAIHSISTSGPERDDTSIDLAAAIRGEASGFLGTTVAAGDLVQMLTLSPIRPVTELRHPDVGHSLRSRRIHVHRSSCSPSNVRRLVPICLTEITRCSNSITDYYKKAGALSKH